MLHIYLVYINKINLAILNSPLTNELHLLPPFGHTRHVHIYILMDMQNKLEYLFNLN